MARAKVGFVTIGQSPRDDIVAEMLPMIGPGVDVIERGALDGLSAGEIHNLKPDKHDVPLITRRDVPTGRLPDVVIVGRHKIAPLIQRHIGELEKRRVSLIALLCTEEFPEIESSTMLLLPSEILRHAVAALRGVKRLGVLIPLAAQRAAARTKWEKTGLEVAVHVADPYHDIPETAPLRSSLAKADVNLIVLDCIAYTMRMKENLAHLTGKPVLLPRSLLAAYIRELAHASTKRSSRIMTTQPSRCPHRD